MTGKPNAIYIAGGGGTEVISATAYGIADRIFREYRNNVGTLYAAVGGMRGALNEDLADVFGWAAQKGSGSAHERLNQLKFYSCSVFGTSRHNPDEEDCKRLVDVFKAHNIRYVFLNGGNDTMEKAIRIQEYAKEQGVELNIVGVPKTIDNDLLGTYICPGYPTFAKWVAYNTMSLARDLDSFSLSPNSARGGKVKEGAIAQVLVVMGRDAGWGAAASILGELDESYAPHIILTKEGGFSEERFLARAQDTFDKYGQLFVVASEGAHDGTDYLANRLKVTSDKPELAFKYHTDLHKNASVSDGRLALFLKLLLEDRLKIPTDVYKDFKVRAEGPNYLGRNNLEILSAPDFFSAIAAGESAVDLTIGEGKTGIMVTLTEIPGITGDVSLEKVADSKKGSKAMTKTLSSLFLDGHPAIIKDGMMIDREVFWEYAEDYIDLNGPNRSELLRGEGFLIPLPRIEFPLEQRVLSPY